MQPLSKWSESLSVVSDCDPMDYTVHRILQVRILKWVAFPFSKGSSQPREDSLPAKPQGKPKNTGVCSLSLLPLLQWILPTRHWTGVSCIAGGFFTNWAIREAWWGERRGKWLLTGYPHWWHKGMLNWRQEAFWKGFLWKELLSMKNSIFLTKGEGGRRGMSSLFVVVAV